MVFRCPDFEVDPEAARRHKVKLFLTGTAFRSRARLRSTLRGRQRVARVTRHGAEVGRCHGRVGAANSREVSSRAQLIYPMGPMHEHKPALTRNGDHHN